MVSFSKIALVLFSSIAASSAQTCSRYLEASKTAAANLQSAYLHNGEYPDQWVWLSALNVFYLRKLDGLIGSSDDLGLINTAFNSYRDHLDYGKSYDDVQWVAIAYIQAGNGDLARKYYDIASEGLDTGYCGGGVFWSGARDYKNAITSELYMTTSGYMYERFGGDRYLNNLRTTWSWLKSTRMRGSNGLFNDGLTRDGRCDNNGQIQWTYNQAALLPGLGYLYKFGGDQSALDDAWGMIDRIIANLTWDGGLREVCEVANQNLCNADQQAFKGITMMYISWFLKITNRDNNGKYVGFIRQQAENVLRYAVGPTGWYSNLWYAANEGGATWNGKTQAAALAGLLAAAEWGC